jgi:hypothetical protein
MFGYIRPFKPELLIRQWTYYQSAYCGLCKQIGRKYGQLPRLTVSYDLTFLVLLGLAMSEQTAATEQAGCILNPVKKKTVMQENGLLDFCADVSVLLAWHKSRDDIRDKNLLRGTAACIAFGRAAVKARRNQQQLDALISRNLSDLAEFEQGRPDPQAAECFGNLLAGIFELACPLFFTAGSESDQAQSDAVKLLGRDLGRWIYLIDAIDDLASDRDNGSWNPFLAMDIQKAREKCDLLLTGIEEALDRTAALLSYSRDAALISNIIQSGLPSVREQVIGGCSLSRL